MNENSFSQQEFTQVVADRSTSRIVNQNALVSGIFDSNGISKSDLAKRLKLSKPAVSKNVADLIEMGLVKENGTGLTGKNGGRKPTMLYINESHRYLGALDLSFQNPFCAVGDLRCNILKAQKFKIDRNASSEDKNRYVRLVFMQMLEELNVSAEQLGVIVISQPGVIDDDGENLYSLTRHHAWTGIGLKQCLMRRLNVPIIVKNDMNLSAIGEMCFGNFGHVNDLIYVSCGIGLGSGVIIGGKLHEGNDRAAGALGEFLSTSGKRADDYVAIDGLLKHVNMKFAETGAQDAGREELTFSRVVELVRGGDQIANRAVYEIGRQLGYIIYNCSVMLNIKTVVFGGEYLKFGKVIFDGIESVLAQEFPFIPEVLPSSLDDMSGIYGGFIVGKDEIFQQTILRGAV